ncbi:MAG: LAGLIDADG family homing endonuclease [Candidatus Aenigmatarchaeota archaeon]
MITINKKLTSDDSKRIKRLYLSGESIFTISESLHVNPSTICDHLEKSGIKRRSAREAGILASKRGRLKKHEIPKSSRKMTEEKAYILGVIVGDGWLHKTKNDSYQIGLQAIDMDFVYEFIRCFEKVYELKPKVTLIEEKTPNWNDKLQARICSKNIFNDIMSYGNVGKYEWTVPKIVFNSPENIKCAFLKGFFDSEGCVDKSKKIITNSVSLGLYDIKSLLVSMDIRSNIIKITKVKGNRKMRYDLNITGRSYIELYAQRIGFSIKRKERKLEILLNNYKLRTTPHQDVIKLKDDILEMRNKGFSYQKIADRLNIGITTAWNYVNKSS